MLDVAVDIRRSSPSFGKYVAVELSAQNKRELFIPRGFAHGFVVLSKKAVFHYKVDNYYSKEHERAIRFDDKTLGIEWGIPVDAIITSEKDRLAPSFADAEVFE